MITFLVPPSVHCTLFEFLLHQKVSLTLRRKIKKAGQILVNGKSAASHTIVKAGDKIEILLDHTCTIIPTPIKIDIVYEDNYFLVVNKPAGMLVHPTTQEKDCTLANAVLHYYKNKYDIAPGYHPVHRLDRNTSGLLIIAKSPYIQHCVSGNNLRSIKKIYIGLASGIFLQDSDVIDSPIAREPSSIIKRQVHQDGQEAVTHYKVVETLLNSTLLQLELLTGRTHQIRVHLASINHPLLGDDLYGGQTTIITRPALHASQIIFNHPITGVTVNLTSPIPEDISKAINLLKIN